LIKLRPYRRPARYHRFGAPESRPRIDEPAVYIIDYMEFGNPTDRHPEHRNKPLVQAVGTKFFTLIEAEPLPAVRIDILEKVELDPHSKIRRPIPITYDDLTSVARTNLPEAIKRIIIDNERLFVAFFNLSQPVNIRLHALELLPGIGKKTMRHILEERKREPFESFKDIKERTKVDPVKTLTERIISELMGNEKYYLFVKPPRKQPSTLYLGYLERLYYEELL